MKYEKENISLAILLILKNIWKEMVLSLLLRLYTSERIRLVGCLKVPELSIYLEQWTRNRK